MFVLTFVQTQTFPPFHPNQLCRAACFLLPQPFHDLPWYQSNMIHSAKVCHQLFRIDFTLAKNGFTTGNSPWYLLRPYYSVRVLSHEQSCPLTSSCLLAIHKHLHIYLSLNAKQNKRSAPQKVCLAGIACAVVLSSTTVLWSTSTVVLWSRQVFDNAPQPIYDRLFYVTRALRNTAWQKLQLGQLVTGEFPLFPSKAVNVSQLVEPVTFILIFEGARICFVTEFVDPDFRCCFDLPCRHPPVIVVIQTDDTTRW